MKKNIFKILVLCFITISGCSNDDDNPVNPPSTGEVLLASVTVDSVVTPSPGTSYKISTISSGTLNFTDRDSARISFYYTGQNNSAITPMEIYYTLDTTKIYIFNSTTLNPAVTEQYINVTVPSPRVNSSFRYQILTTNTSGISFFKFRELKIYKK